MAELQNQDKAIIKDDELINKKTKSVPKPREQKSVDTNKE
jgi:hypothetical protein